MTNAASSPGFQHSAIMSRSLFSRTRGLEFSKARSAWFSAVGTAGHFANSRRGTPRSCRPHNATRALSDPTQFDNGHAGHAPFLSNTYAVEPGRKDLSTLTQGT